MTIQKTLPDDDQAEVSLFGPGYGECIVIHYGNQDWFIVDSCLDPLTKRPISLVYLEELGVEKENIKGLIITHWHSDHTAGASQIVESCPNVRVYFSGALNQEEAYTLAYLYDAEAFSGVGKEIKDFKRIADYLFKNGERDRLAVANIGRSFFHKNNSLITSRMLALSPSDVAVSWAKTKLIQQLPSRGAQRVRNVVSDSPNFNAVALYFSFSDVSVLLGSDLEESGNPDTGWSAILNSDIVDQHELTKSQVFKVPHHGSGTGHHQGVWDDMLTNKPISIATPYNKLRDPLPTQTDTDRIVALSSTFSVTRDHAKQKPPRKADNATERMLKNFTKDREAINNKIGHIQIRFKNSNDLSVGKCPNVVTH